MPDPFAEDLDVHPLWRAQMAFSRAFHRGGIRLADQVLELVAEEHGVPLSRLDAFRLWSLVAASPGEADKDNAADYFARGAFVVSGDAGPRFIFARGENATAVMALARDPRATSLGELILRARERTGADSPPRS